MNPSAKGCIHLYSGDGKGKTTAAMGLALRAIAAGWPVLIAQFLKDGTSGELVALRQFTQVRIFSGKTVPGFSSRYSPEDRRVARAENDTRLGDVIELVRGLDGQQLLILDEIVGAVHQGLVDEGLLVDLLDHHPASLEIVLTGRQPSPALCERADYHSEMRKIKHPYDRGIAARKGVEK